jgi:hypothetical protein
MFEFANLGKFYIQKLQVEKADISKNLSYFKYLKYFIFQTINLI